MKLQKNLTKHFTSVGIALANKILMFTKDVIEHLPKCNTWMKHNKFSFQEFEIAFKKLKRSKATGCDSLNGNINIDVCDSIETIFINC